MASNHDDPPSIIDPEQVPALLHALRHEVVQPLHTLGLLLDLVPTASDQKRLASWAESGNRALDNLRRMLRILGDTAKLDLAPQAAASQPVRLGSFLTGLVTAKRDLIQLAGASVRVGRTDRNLETDPDLLRLAIDALLDNALRHARGRVLLGVRPRGARLLLGVWDRGEGIEAENCIRYQQDFVRGEPSEEQARRQLGMGLGLGLGIARRVAAQLGAEFFLRSVRGKGTVAGLLFETAPR